MSSPTTESRKEIIRQNRKRLNKALVHGFCAELLGVFIMVTIGNGATAQSVLSENVGEESFISINFAYGLGLAIAMYFTQKVSGGHLNPAVTIAFALFQKFSWIFVPIYILGQVIGGYLAGLCVYLVYYDALYDHDGGERKVLGEQGTGRIFATYPKPYLSNGNGVIDQVVGSALLVSVYFLMANKIKRRELSSGYGPMVVGFTLIVIGLSFGMNSGYAINPARDIGPRLFILTAGWGMQAMTEPNDLWWLVPLLSPVLGAILGGGLYTICDYIMCRAEGEEGHQWKHFRHQQPNKMSDIENRDVLLHQSTIVDSLNNSEFTVSEDSVVPDLRMTSSDP